MSLLLKRTLEIAIEGTMEGQGTPDQSQAGPGEPTRDTTLRTSVHNQLADGEQGTPFNT